MQTMLVNITLYWTDPVVYLLLPKSSIMIGHFIIARVVGTHNSYISDDVGDQKALGEHLWPHPFRRGKGSKRNYGFG